LHNNARIAHEEERSVEHAYTASGHYHTAWKRPSSSVAAETGAQAASGLLAKPQQKNVPPSKIFQGNVV
jgi:hypothetical protein